MSFSSISLSSPKTDWDKFESAPGTLQILLKASGVPIDHYSYEATELLRDKEANWRSIRRIRESPALATSKDPGLSALLRTADTTIYAIDVSFSQLTDKAERDYLNELPTSFSLPAEAVDRLRVAAGKIIMASPDFRRLLQEVGTKIIVDRPSKGEPAAVPTEK